MPSNKPNNENTTHNKKGKKKNQGKNNVDFGLEITEVEHENKREKM